MRERERRGRDRERGRGWKEGEGGKEGKGEERGEGERGGGERADFIYKNDVQGDIRRISDVKGLHLQN